MATQLAQRFAGRRILLGISAGIAAYKSAQLARLLKQAGCEVRVVMTEGAQAFITPLTLQALTGEPVRTSLLDPEAEAGMGHIELARWAETILIAPATADLMARLALGMADDLLTTLCLASDAEKVMAPAMNQAMWRHVATQRNAERLAQDGWRLLGPASGDQACGDVGPGRMLEPEAIVAELIQPSREAAQGQAARVGDAPARGLHVVITAGPTREPLDPVRYLSNHSSGKMGFALAAAAAELGARVSLISGPVSLPTPVGVERTDVETARQMHEASRRLAADCDLFIGCAAVADYRAATAAEHKIKKREGEEGLTLKLIKNPDIIADIAHTRDAAGGRPFVVGFAAETRDLEAYARDKLERKRLDMIVANDVSAAGLGFGADDNAALLLWRDGEGEGGEQLPPQPKRELARAVIERALGCLTSRPVH
ncbi:bifunctional phosphopantothenoylcysteine decarboxylase/phosphopantothenate--cysteine ligase CoaBC [Halomonas sp. MCCC 1A17488]|uniref:bifunctional phosphopantothenoylcysteine decarboxylase/phosphopantothenate--cysteine ligase CoaBC n=1 Tax=unclassified Halomonas TaxID=2609666 RepID=UPI0018D268D3|nr:MULTISPECIES: bifunctional phosphopantothenoylcysteine decarboxylase/phosphopantothenate--cysteine ligase CoaBC [unclassified Halomonas]MCE8016773.1 bifunctional phosphopantothenoylcysteine decarboxylase/phosphopantothenate--cysteine ligase CoaBC [Halomonas sp. MCCC 1A17488]MCG3240106.1 bifunctional phosphopantothenoylcysteine decarboxylase/phosphopantothenate--cysteine ligase CoaBC [Halomonas sp. MCCC 1A17488]QPP50013.1 bifunctional phosphopantothenoylcysteine decarboxylase/phosphopantothena